LPPSLRAAHGEQNTRWQLNGADETLRSAFAKQTCNGCHLTARNPADVIDGNFHISPHRSGSGKLSGFLFDATNRGRGELASRWELLRKTACAVK
jgi:hypothetical protein